MKIFTRCDSENLYGDMDLNLYRDVDLKKSVRLAILIHLARCGRPLGAFLFIILLAGSQCCVEPSGLPQEENDQLLRTGRNSMPPQSCQEKQTATQAA